MNQACQCGGKSLLNEQRACPGNSAVCCIAPCLACGGCRVLGVGYGRVPGVPQGCAGVQRGRGRAGGCRDAPQQAAVTRCWGSGVSARWGVSCRAL